MWRSVVPRRVLRAGLDGRRSSSASGSPRGLDKTRRPPLPDVVRKPPRLPFLKCIYAGQYDVETLTYPETLNLERHRDLESRVERLRETGGNADAVRRLGLFGMSVPYPSSGLDLSDTEIARVFEHVDRGDAFRALFEHTLCADVVKTFGTPGQKSKYLPLFASGAVCSLHDDRRAAFSAAPLPDGGWELAGSVRNSAQAYALFVKGGRAYVVDAGRLSADGDVLRLRRTVVRPDDVLDNVDLTGIARRGKLYACAALVSSVKELVRSAVANVLPKSRLNMKLRDYDSVLKILARSMVNAYTIESMIYLTTWMTDGFRDQDVELETAAIQLFGRQTVSTTLAELKMLIGRSSIKEPYLTLFNDVDDMIECLDGSIELANFISRRGVEFFNKSEYKENVSFLTVAYRNLMMKRNNPSLKYGLQQYLHPALIVICLRASFVLDDNSTLILFIFCSVFCRFSRKVRAEISNCYRSMSCFRST